MSESLAKAAHESAHPDQPPMTADEARLAIYKRGGDMVFVTFDEGTQKPYIVSYLDHDGGKHFGDSAVGFAEAIEMANQWSEMVATDKQIDDAARTLLYD